MFAIDIQIPGLTPGRYFNEILFEAAKKRDERETLSNFFHSLSLSEKPVIEEVVETAERQVDIMASEEVLQFRPQALTFYLKTPLIDDFTLQIIEQSKDRQCRVFATKTRRGTSNGQKPPAAFPGEHKRARAIVEGSISTSIGEKEIRQYLVRRFVRDRILQIAKDLFFAVNSGLDVKQTLQFMEIIYELEKIKTADFANEKQIKSNLITAIKKNQPLRLIHIKCLRFTYPGGHRLQLLEHILQDTEYDYNHQSRRPQDETPIFNRLDQTRSIFASYGVKIDLLVLVSDQDLIDYFPNGGEGLVPDEDLQTARLSLQKYKSAVEKLVPFGKTLLFREFLKEQGYLTNYDVLRSQILSDLYHGRSKMPEAYIESKIDYRFASNAKIFQVKSSRQFARDRVYAQLASLQALSILGHESVLIEEDHGNDNRFIGGCRQTSLPVLFINLKSYNLTIKP